MTSTYNIRRYGRVFTIQVDDLIMETHYKKGELCEFHMLDWIEKNIQRGGIWIDAGANVGNHTLPFALWADGVVALEPMKVNYDMLLRNIWSSGLVDKVSALQYGVGEKYELLGAHLGGTGQNCQWVLSPDDDGPKVAVLPIDDLVANSRFPVRLIKLDVEGMEEAAITGAWKTVERFRPELFIEIWDEPVLERVTARLAPLGYKLIERWNVAPTFHFSASGRYPVTYTPAERLRP